VSRHLPAVTVALLACSVGGCVDAIRDLAGIPDPPDALADAAPDLPRLELPELPETDVDGAQCVEDEDCAFNDGCCTRGFCYQGTCQQTWLQDCCTSVGGCAVSSSLYSGQCDAPCGVGSCVKSLVLPDSCSDEPLFSFDPAEDSVATMALTDPNANDNVTWHVSARRGVGGTRALYAGDLRCPSYHTGPLDAACEPVAGAIAAPVELVAATPPVLLPADRPVVLKVWLWMGLEASTDGLTNAFDGLEIGVRRTVAQYTRKVWSSRDTPVPQRQWVPVLVDLNADAGAEVSVWLTFATIDGLDNDHEGVYVGPIEILTPCAGDRVCPEPGGCTVGKETPVAGTGDALCVVSGDPPGEPCTPCVMAADCATNDACDTASCEGGVCEVVHELTPECCTPDDAWAGPPGFEVELGEGWSAEPEEPTAGAGEWHVSQQRAFEGLSALRFGVVGDTSTSVPGVPASQTLWSPVMTVPAEKPALRFTTWLSTEWDAAPSSSNPLGLDRLSIELALAGVQVAPTEIWGSEVLGGTTQGAWVAVEVPLDGFQGLDVRVGLRFDTADEAANDYEGVYIDSVTMVRRCPQCDPETPGCDDGRLR